MGFKTFVGSLVRRIGDLIIKNLGIKAEFALVTTWLYARNPESPMHFAAFLAAWIVFIGGREARKYLDVLREIRRGKEPDA